MSTGIISTGLSGLQVAQLGLLTTEHNITNANTPGFTRQRTIQATNVAMLTGAGFVGQGAHVSTIERMYDQFLTGQVNRTQTTSSELDTYYTQIKQIDNMLADPNSGVSPALQDFFSGVQQVAANPSQLPARQAMISSAQALVARYQGIEDRISQMYAGINSQIGTTVATINSYSEQIAELNNNIVIAGSSINQPPNDLLDQRDQLVLELNKLVRVTTTTNSNGTYNVYVGNGQQLVTGTKVTQLTAEPSLADPSRIAVGLKNATGSQELPESLVTGGALGGLLSFRSDSLDRVANDLGRNAASLALTFNAQHALGQDLVGSIDGDLNFVADFFTLPTPNVIPGSGGFNVTYAEPTFDGNFYTKLTGSDYRLQSDGTNFTLTRLSDNAPFPTVTTLADLQSQLAEEGLDINAVPAAGSYLIQPTRDAARNIAVNPAIAANARLIAAASPIVTKASSANTGTATMSAGSVTPGYSLPSAPAPSPDNLLITLTFSPPSTLNWLDEAGATGSVPYVAGSTIPIGGINFAISGTPNAGDTFTISRNTGAVSDGRNALALGQLQTQNTMTGKTATFQSAKAQLVSDAGNKTREIELKGAAQSALLKQSTDARDSLSGVNLDEEAANLMRYQQAYQASAKMLELGNKLFDVLLSVTS